MNIEELTNKVSIWGARWSYSLTRKEIICFTEKIIDFDEKDEMWVITYKPDAWFKDIGHKDILKLLKIKELRKRFRLFKDDWFTEREKAEVCEETKGVNKTLDIL